MCGHAGRYTVFNQMVRHLVPAFKYTPSSPYSCSALFCHVLLERFALVFFRHWSVQICDRVTLLNEFLKFREHDHNCKMPPIVEPETASNSVWRFVEKNKYALAAAAGLIVAGTAGYVIYANSNDDESGSDKPLTPLAKKNKKRRSKKKNAGKEKANGSDETILYPVDSQGSPDITEQYLATLTPEVKEKLALQLKEQGNVAFKAKELEKAIVYYTGALSVKKDPVFFSNRSACYASLEQYEKVIEDTSAALKLQPDYPKCLLRRATAYEKLKKYLDAMFDLTALTLYNSFDNRHIEPVLERNLKAHAEEIVAKQIAEQVPTLPSALSISSFLGSFSAENELEDVDRASVKTGSGDDYLIKALDKVRESTNDSYELADSYFNQAVKAYGDVVKDDPEAKHLALALEYAGALKFLKNSAADALIDLDKALILNPRPRVYIYKALIAADKGDYEEGTKIFDEAIKLDPKSSDAYYHKGQLFYLLNQLPEAEKNFNKAKELNPANVFGYIQLACIEYRKDNKAGSDRLFADIKKRFPKSPEVPNYRGEILADTGDIAAAIKEYDASYQLQKDAGVVSIGVVPLVNKATLLARLGPDGILEASKILEQAANEDTKSELARVTLAQIRLQQDEIEDAIALFEEASKLARTAEEKVQATSYAEAAKMQLRIKQVPELNQKVKEMLAAYGAQR